MAPTTFANILSGRLQVSSGIDVTSYTYEDSFNRVGAAFSVTAAFNPNESVGDVGDNVTISYQGRTFYAFAASKTTSASGQSGWEAQFNFFDRASKITQYTPAKPWKFMSMPGDELLKFAADIGTPGLSGTAKNVLDYIPFIAVSDQFGNGGWTAKSILAGIADFIGVEIQTNVPNFFVRDFSVDATFFQGITDLVAPYDPKYFFYSGTLFIVYYGGTLKEPYTGTVRLRTANTFSVKESVIDRPPVVRFLGGDGPFDKDEYTGKKASSTDLVLNTSYVIGSSVFTDGNAPPVLFYSYGEPFEFTETTTETKGINPEQWPQYQEAFNAITDLYALTSDDTKYALRGTFFTTNTSVFARTFFDEPGEQMFSVTKNYLYGIEGTGLDWLDPVIVGETYEMFQFADTVDVAYDSPRLTCVYDWVEGGYRPCRVKLQTARLPNKSTDDASSTLVARLMPSELEMEYRLYAEETTSAYVKGDLVKTLVKVYAPCVYVEGFKHRVTEGSFDVSMSLPNMFAPLSWAVYDSDTADLTDLIHPACLIRQEETTYRRVGKNGYLKSTTIADHEDGRNKPRLKSESAYVKGEMPSQPLKWRTSPLKYDLYRTGTSTFYTQPPYEQSVPFISDWNDLKRVAREVDRAFDRPSVQVSAQIDSEVFAGAGWKVNFSRSYIKVPGGRIVNLPSHSSAFISSVQVNKNADAGSATTVLAIDLF